jgi:hypothetical protein
MADKVPVQDKLSQILAELMWCLAGAEEDDEYAGQVYMQMEEEENGFYEDEDGDIMWTEVVEDGSDDDEVDDDEDDENDWQDMPSDDDDDEGNEVEGINESEDDDEDEEGERYDSMNEPHCRGAHLVSLYVGTFLRTIKREWGNVDKHRVDKFYTAVRLMIREVRESCRLLSIVACFLSLLWICSLIYNYLLRRTNTWQRGTGT